MRLRLFVLALVGAIATFGVTSPTVALRSDSATRPGACSGGASGDFNNDSNDDLAVGVPGEGVGDVANAGAVNILYGAGSGIGLQATGEGPLEESDFIHQDTPGVNDVAEEGDAFGRCLVAGTFNNDSFADLAIGVPKEDLGGIRDAGAVHVIYGSATGLDPLGSSSIPADQFWHQDRDGVEDKAQAGDQFGSALAAGDFDQDQVEDLAIGVPLEDVGDNANAGAVNVLYATTNELSSVGDQFWTQNSPGIEDKAENGDHFGAALAAGDVNADNSFDLAIGVPLEDVRRRRDAGAVNVLYGIQNVGLDAANDQFWHQNSIEVEDKAETGDRFGAAVTFGDFDEDGFDDLAIGVPLEDVLGVQDAGAVNVLYSDDVALTALNNGETDQFWHQGNTNAGETLGVGDEFGAALAAADFEGDQDDDLAVGVPGEDIDTAEEAGAVEVLYGVPEAPAEAGGLVAPADLFHQDVANIEDIAESFDHYGQALAAGNYDADSHADLAIGIPGENVSGGTFGGEGAANVIYGNDGGLDPQLPIPDQFWHQDVAGVEDTAEPDDLFGRALG